jgi:hypothetical protein
MKIFDSKKNEIERHDQYYPNSDLSNIYSKNRNKIIEIINLFDQIQKNGKITDSEYKKIEKSLAENWDVIYFYLVGKYLARIETEIPDILEKISSFMDIKNWKLRRNTVSICTLFKNEEIIEVILKKGINDKSVKVFEYTMEKIIRCYLDKNELISLAEKRINSMENKKEKKFFLDFIKLHKDGYLIEPFMENRMSIDILIDSHSSFSFTIHIDEYKAIKNIDEYIKNKRLKHINS